MIICLVRHGQTNWNINTLLQGRSDIPLNDYGKKQAQDVGAFLQKHDQNWDVILSSPLTRAIETAEIIKAKLDLKSKIIIVPELIERSFGSLEGKPLNQEMYEILDQGGHGIEEIDLLLERAEKAIRDIVKTYPKKKVLIVSHAQFIKAALTTFKPDFDFRYPLRNSSLNYLEAKEEQIQVLEYDIIP